MRLTLLVLGVVLLCAASTTAQENRGRERLRELIKKARAGDAQARQALLERRKNRTDNPSHRPQQEVSPKVTAAPETKPIENKISRRTRVKPTAADRQSAIRRPAALTRSSSRAATSSRAPTPSRASRVRTGRVRTGRNRARQPVTAAPTPAPTDAPTEAPTEAPTTAPPTTQAPPAFTTTEAPPSLFQPAQHGEQQNSFDQHAFDFSVAPRQQSFFDGPTQAPPQFGAERPQPQPQQIRVEQIPEVQQTTRAPRLLEPVFPVDNLFEQETTERPQAFEPITNPPRAPRPVQPTRLRPVTRKPSRRPEVTERPQVFEPIPQEPITERPRAPKPVEPTRLEQVTRGPSRRPEAPRTLAPHTTLHRGLEVGNRNEFNNNLVETAARDPNARPAPVQTTRRYSYYDDAGNYVFGYEAEDGSFKEEIRGLDCIVRGKYGYIDPHTGIKREYNYVSGNVCDPNDPEGLLTREEPMPLNNQFLEQTGATQLTEAQMEKVKAALRRQNPNRHRQQSRPRTVATTQPPRRRPAPVPATQPQRLAPVTTRPVEQVAASPNQDRFPVPNQERFPVPDFLSGRPQSRPAPSMFQPAQHGGQREAPQPRPQPQATTAQPRPQPRPQPAQPRPQPPKADLTPTRVPSLFQPAQFGAGGRGVPPQTNEFNFNTEFQDVFNHFGNSFNGPAVQHKPTQRPTPPPTRAPATRPPPPAPTTARAQTSHNSIPSLFQPAQFGNNQPAPAPAPATTRPPIDHGSSFTLAPSHGSGFHQLVFDAASGGFKTVHTQGHAPSAPVHTFNPVTHAPVTHAPRAFNAPVTHAPHPTHAPLPTHAPAIGRTLPLFNNAPRSNPLPRIPQSAAEFDDFFANFRG